MFGKKELQKPYVACVVPAAGSASRMNGIDKQFEPIEGIPVIVRTLQALAASDWIDELVVVARRDDIPDIHALIRAYAVEKVRSVVAGADSRRKSVACGLAAVSERAVYLAVHDGARPLVPQQVIADAVMDAFRYGAAAAAVPAVDTYKLADEERNIVGTPDRARLFAVQTPQVFELEQYRRAAAASQIDYTDDCQMLEAIGQKVHLSQGDYTNIKITTPIDLLTAQAIVLTQEGIRL